MERTKLKSGRQNSRVNERVETIECLGVTSFLDVNNEVAVRNFSIVYCQEDETR